MEEGQSWRSTVGGGGGWDTGPQDPKVRAYGGAGYPKGSRRNVEQAQSVVYLMRDRSNFRALGFSFKRDRTTLLHQKSHKGLVSHVFTLFQSSVPPYHSNQHVQGLLEDAHNRPSHSPHIVLSLPAPAPHFTLCVYCNFYSPNSKL